MALSGPISYMKKSAGDLKLAQHWNWEKLPMTLDWSIHVHEENNRLLRMGPSTLMCDAVMTTHNYDPDTFSFFLSSLTLNTSVPLARLYYYSYDRSFVLLLSLSLYH